MRRTLFVLAAVGASTFVPAAVSAQSPPTTIEVETETSEVTVTTLDVKEVDTDDDDDGGKAGLFGLFGLLGLAGLAGLKRKREDTLGPRTGTVTADTQARGATRHE